jgi:hypothetical protein
MPTTSAPALAAERFPPGMISLDRTNIYRESYTSLYDVIETVSRWGIIVFPGFVSGQLLRDLNAELDLQVEVRKQLGCLIDEYDNMINLRLDREKYRVAFPKTMDFFGQEFMREIATTFFQPEDFKLNYEIFSTILSETKGPQTKPPFALHFDKWHCLKFYVYLSDTDERNGAMRATPGSIVRNRPIRQRAMAELSNVETMENVLPEPEESSIPISGPAGTLLIFDTDMNHGASHVEAEYTRRTIRTHTITLPQLRRMGYQV